MIRDRGIGFYLFIREIIITPIDGAEDRLPRKTIGGRM